MSLANIADRQIKRPKNEATRTHKAVTIPNIINTTIEADRKHFQHGYLKEFSKNFSSDKNGLNKLFLFIRKNIRYKQDKTLREVIQSPGFLWHTTRQGDCKSMSCFVAEILSHKGIPYNYRFVSDQPSGKINHVYISAKVGGREITIDPTTDKFNIEMKVTKKMDLSPGVYSIAGYNSRNYPGKIAPKYYINYTTMTAGEMYAALMYEQLKIVGDFYGDKEILKDADLVQNAMKAGLHQSSTFSNISGLSSRVGEKLVRARNMQKPASDLVSLANRKNVGIGEIAPVDDCYLLWRKYEEENDLRQRYSERKRRKMRDDSNLFKNCVKANEYKRIFNSNLEGASYQLLYNFNPNPNESPALVTTKTVLQKNAIGALSNVSGISVQNFDMWLRNGVLRGGVKAGLSPMQPEVAYEQLLKDASNSVNGLTIATAAAAIYKLVAAAVKAVIKIIKGMSKEDRLSFETMAQGVGSNAFGPQPTDFQGIVSNKPAAEIGLGSNNLLIAAALGGAYFLIK